MSVENIPDIVYNHQLNSHTALDKSLRPVHLTFTLQRNILCNVYM